MADDNGNLFAVFRRLLLREPDRLIVSVPEGPVLSRSDLDREAGRLAAFLLEQGLEAGDRVTVQVEKSLQALFLYLACLRAGLVFHPLNSDYLSEELRFFIADAAPTALICDPSSLGELQPVCEQLGVARVFTLAADGGGSLTAAAAACAPTDVVVSRTDDDIACLLYSSGTTGRPKGIPLTHGNLRSNGEALVAAWGFREDDVLLHALPIHHAHGLFVALHCVFLSGASLRWLPRFSAARVIAELPASTCFMGVPTYYVRLLGEPGLDRELASAMRLFLCGSAPLQLEVFEAFAERTGHRILERYGMSETGMNCSNPLRGERRAGTVGLPLPGVSVRVVDERWQPLPKGEIGQLQVRGANVFHGYWRLPEKTQESFSEDGFFDTGDQAVISQDGYVSIVGRSKDMVITGGLNVYPREIELVINSLDGVLESAVIGVPHRDFGEGVVAVVVPERRGRAPGEGAVIAALKQRLAGFKVPKRAVFVEELPRNAMGKIQKNVLREHYADLFGA